MKYNTAVSDVDDATSLVPDLEDNVLLDKPDSPRGKPTSID